MVSKLRLDICGDLKWSHNTYLVYGQEHFKGYPLVWLQMVCTLFDIRFSGVLSQGPERVADLGHMDLAVAARVKQLKGLLEFFENKQNIALINVTNFFWWNMERIHVAYLPQK